MKHQPKPNTEKIQQEAKRLIEHYYPRKKITISSLQGGITNHVFEVKVGKEELVIRISEETEKINSFLKEQWAVRQAKKKGVPVPEILEVGNDIIQLPYMIQQKINGLEASNHPLRWDILKEMGHYAAIIHTIPTTGFGHNFDWSQNTLSKNNSWKDYLHTELRPEERMEILRKHKMLDPKTIARIKTELRKMEKWKQTPSLNHGDLRLKNMLVDKDGKIVAMIDWENCISFISPYWDVSIALHDLSVEGQWRFLEGYGMKDKQIIEIAPALKVFNILNYALVIERMVASKDKRGLSHYVVRMHGALDMFSL
jgi:aminoglycoside phosphotransferase (APT) family kinase protein